MSFCLFKENELAMNMRSDFFLTGETPEKGATIIAYGSRAQRIIMKAADNQLLVLV
jgi:hypothetical protein